MVKQHLKDVEDEARSKDLVIPSKAGVWQRRLREASHAIQLASTYDLQPTPYFVEAYHYYHRAKSLQEKNLGYVPENFKSGCDLQDNIPIYDTVRRRFAGFSNVLEQLRYGDQAPKIVNNRLKGWDYPRFRGDDRAWLYVCLVHRVTGSGASFEHDHGWRNTIVPLMVSDSLGIPPMSSWISYNRHMTMFTSIGNQIPPFNKLKDPFFRLAGIEYLVKIAPQLVDDVWFWFEQRCRYGKGPAGIKETVDQVLDYQRKRGCKQFKFVLTAWVMDMAEYLPHLVDATSDCYHGKNAQEALSVCLRPTVRMNSQEFFDRGTRLFSNLTGTLPMDVEDASPGCDLIRWLENYVPKKGFDHVREAGLFNNSSLRYFKGRQPEGNYQ
jgi:hypothetical protein